MVRSKQKAQNTSDKKTTKSRDDSPARDKQKTEETKQDIPKRPSSAYIFFGKDKREEIKQQNPDLCPKEMISKIGQTWTALSEQDKEPYNQLAQQDKQRWNTAVEKLGYVPKVERKSKKDGKTEKKKTKRDPNAPKGPIGAYIFYSNAMREEVKGENPGIKITEISKVLGARWRDLADAEKFVYQEQAQQDKVRFEDEMKTFQEIATFKV